MKTFRQVMYKYFFFSKMLYNRICNRVIKKIFSILRKRLHKNETVNNKYNLYR